MPQYLINQPAPQMPTPAALPPNPIENLSQGVSSGMTLGLQARQIAAQEEERRAQVASLMMQSKIQQQKQLTDYMNVAHETYKDLADVNPDYAFNFYKQSIAPLHQAFLASHGVQADFSNVNPMDETPPVVEKINELMDRAAKDPTKIPAVSVSLQQMANMPSTGKLMKQKIEDSMKALGTVTDYNKHQDELENQFRQNAMSLRSDQTIQRLETQRDAAAQAYTTLRLNQDKTGQYNLSNAQLVDLYGQLWKAQTGGILSPSELDEMNQSSLQKNWSKMASFLNMSRNAAPKEVGDRLVKMTSDLGDFVDTQHGQIMSGKLQPPTGLLPDRAQKALGEINRGFSFQQLKQRADKKSDYQPNQQNMPAFNSIQEAEAAKLPSGTKIRIGNRTATVQ